MNKLITSVLGVAVAVALIVGFVAVNKTPKVITGSQGNNGARGEQGIQGPKGDRGEQGPQGLRGPAGSAGAEAPVRLGSVTSPDIIQNYISIGGVREEYYRFPLNTSTTSVCTIPMPTASSTLIFAGVDMKTSTTTNFHFQLATAATSNATTTILAQESMLANSRNQKIIATSTLLNQSYAAGTWIVGKMVAASVGGVGGGPNSSPTGTCYAGFRITEY